MGPLVQKKAKAPVEKQLVWQQTRRPRDVPEVALLRRRLRLREQIVETAMSWLNADKRAALRGGARDQLQTAVLKPPQLQCYSSWTISPQGQSFGQRPLAPSELCWALRAMNLKVYYAGAICHALSRPGGMRPVWLRDPGGSILWQGLA